MKHFMLMALVVTAACSGSPTAPAPTPTPIPDPPPVVTPAPDPEPAPTPVPPEPPAPRGFTFDAEIGFEHWYGQPVFPGHFELAINPTRVEAGSHGFDILAAEPNYVSVIAGTRNVETLTIEYNSSGEWVWTYNGLAGQASGGLKRR
jgi:hypothetical protein